MAKFEPRQPCNALPQLPPAADSKVQRLVDKLKELFQLDQPDLDFGLYRIMHAKAREVTQFLEQDLLPKVREAFAQYPSADNAGAVGSASFENEVYDHLYSFFRRYYSEGDFLSKRVYKEGVYAIPYEGEEVKLHWANHDQHYIKTSEYLRDYAFRLRPDDSADPMRVHFKLVDAAEGEHGNVKAAEGKERRFVLAAENFMEEQERELSLRFEYRPARVEDWPETQRVGKDKAPSREALAAIAEQRVFAVNDSTLRRWIVELQRPHVKGSGEQVDYSRLLAHLRRYTARNTFDYFIHKNLGGFLRRELDFYIKNELMRLDDIESESAPKVEQYLSKIKAIRSIAGKIIDFLAQLEDFQKKLWLKKKFVVATSWCVRVGCVPEAFYPEIAANDAQRDEWVKLCAIDEIGADDATPSYSKPLTKEFLAAHSTLVIDTRLFSQDFTARLLESIGPIDRQTDGVMIHSENFQALNLMQARHRNQVKCVYIDPPYNTGADSFAYRDAYQHSSWLAMATSRLKLSDRLLESQASLFISVDDHEAARLQVSLEGRLPRSNHVTNIIWQKVDSPNDNKVPLTPDHEYVLCYSTDLALPHFQPMQDPSILDAYRKDPTTGVLYRDRLLKKNGANSRRIDRPTMYFPVPDPEGNDVFPLHDNGEEACWALAESAVCKLIAANKIVWKRRVVGGRERWEPYTREYASANPTRPYPTIWTDVKTMRQAKAQQVALFGTSAGLDTVKPTQLVERLQALSGNQSGTILDFFAGSGTTGHATINLNRQDGGGRKFILVEMAHYFDTVLLPRIKKVIFSPDWKEGKPIRRATPDEANRSPGLIKVVRLESYEDAVNNLALRRSPAQQSLLDHEQARGPGKLREQYLLNYQLEVESRGSASLLSIDKFSDPEAYQLRVKTAGSDESRVVNVDLVETFNSLIGLAVEQMAAPKRFAAQFERDSEGRLTIRNGLRQDAAGPWWFRTVTGATPDDRKVLVIWRKLTDDIEQDNVVLEEWFEQQGSSTRGRAFEVIYVNGGNTLGNLKTAADTWKVRLIEADFHRLMFDTADE